MSELFDAASKVAVPSANPLFGQADTIGEEDEVLRQSLQHGVKQSPDAAAKNQANAKQLDIPMDLVDRKPAEVNQVATERAIFEKIKGSENARKFYSDPDRAAAHHDNVDALVYLENTLKSMTNQLPEDPLAVAKMGGQGLMVGAHGLAGSFERIPEAGGRLADLLIDIPGIKQVNEFLGLKELGDTLGINPKGTFYEAISEGIEIDGVAYGPSQLADRQSNATKIFTEMTAANEQAGQAFDKALDGDFAELGQVVTSPKMWAAFVGQAIPSLVAMVASGGNIGVIAAMEGLEVTSDVREFEERTGTKVSPQQWAAATAQVMALNSLAEKFGFDQIMKSGGVLRWLLAGAAEGGTEMFQAANTNVAIMIQYDKDKKWSEGVLQGGMGGFGAGGGGGALRSIGSATGPASRYSQDMLRADRALQFSAALDESVAAASELKLEGRDKSEIREYIKEALGAETSVYMAPEDADAFFQANPEVMEALPEETSAAITEALTAGLDVAIPMEDYLTHFTDFHAEISDILRNDMDGMTTAEANRWAETANTEMTQDAERILTEMDLESDFAQSADKVRADIESQLSTIMPVENAKKIAALESSFLVVAANKEGTTPEGLLEKHPQLRQRWQVAPTVAELPEDLQNVLNQAEQDEYQQAVAKGLDMTTGARMVRASEMGYDTSKVYYHGTKLRQYPETESGGIAPGTEPGEFTKFDLEMGTRPFIFVSEEPDMANQFAGNYNGDPAGNNNRYYGPDGARVLPLYVKAEKTFDYENMSTEEIESLDTYLHEVQEQLKFDGSNVDAMLSNVVGGAWATIESPIVQNWIQREGYDSFTTMELGSKNLAVFDPSQLRSVNAAFDPDFEGSPALLAQSAADAQWESWTPEVTKGGVIKGAPEWVNNPTDLKQLEQLLHQLTQEGLAGRYWYEESARKILELTRGDFVEAERLIQVIAIYSPQTSVQVNTGFAVRAWTQWKEGWPINVKTGDQDAKATDVFNGKDYEGRKTNSFYQNLMYEIVNKYPESIDSLKLDQDLVNTFNKPATIDVWMLRAFGYLNDSASNDKGAGKYSFSENYLRKITAQLNTDDEADPWTPHQVQAAIWTAMKARYELHDVKQATNEESVAEGYSVKVGKNKFERKSGVENKRKHLAIWRKNAMAVSSARASRAATEQAASFETFVNQMTRVITWEAKPSEKLGLDIFGASQDVIQQFTRDAASLILTEEGEDTLATLLGVPLNYVSFSEGAYDGAVTPNALSHLLPPKDPGAFGIKEAQTYARAIQYIFKQDAVPWFRPEPLALSKAAQDKQKFRVINLKTGNTVPKSKLAPDGGAFDSLEDAQKLAAKRGDGFGVRGGEYAHGVTLLFDHPLTVADEKAVVDLLGEGGGFTKIASAEIAIVNFRDDETHVPRVDDDVFAKNLAAIADDLMAIGLTDASDFMSQGEYGYEHNWTQDPIGQAILDQKGIANRPDIQEWVQYRRAEFETLLEDYSGENLQRRETEAANKELSEPLFQSAVSSNVAPFDPAYLLEGKSIVKTIVVAPDQLRGYEGAHAADRAAFGLQQVAEGKADPRRPPSVRLDADGKYTVLDGRSGVTAAINAGYTQIPVRIIDDVHDKNGEVVDVPQELEDLYAKSARAKDHFDKAMESIAYDNGGWWIDTPLKGRGRTTEKVYSPREYNGDVSRLKDMLRGTIAVKTIADAHDALNQLTSIFTKPIEIKNSLEIGKPINFSGYTDIKVVLDFEGVKAEIQINTRDQVMIKEGLGHQFYDLYRDLPMTLENVELMEAAQAIEMKLYRDSYELSKQGTEDSAMAMAVVNAVQDDIERFNAQFGSEISPSNAAFEIISPLWVATPGLKSRGGSVSHARQVMEDLSNATGIPSTSNNVAVSGIDETSNAINLTSTDSVTQPAPKRMWDDTWWGRTMRKPVGEFFNAPNNRGQIQFGKDGAVITLLEGADLSTALHELTHYFFESYMVLAQGNEEIAGEMQTMINFINEETGKNHTLAEWQTLSMDERRAGHELVARAGERYFFEGKAPSLELQSLFDTFRSWLVQVYKSLRGLNAKLTPEVREVFDRMLASEEQIRARRVAGGYQALFESIEESGMTPAKWTEYQNMNEMDRRAAESALTARSLKDMQWLDNARSRLLKEMQASHKAKRTDMRDQVADEVRREPVYYAMHFLKTGETADADGNPITIDAHKLDRAEFQAMFPNMVLPRGMTEKDGVPLDAMAQELGWDSGNELVDAILRAEPKQERIERLTDARMLETYGDISNPEKMAQAVEEAVHGEAHIRFAHTELTALTKNAGVGNVLARAAKAFANQAMQRKKVKDIKPYPFTLAERRAARNAMRSLKAGDQKSAAEHKRAEVLNLHFFRAANNARKDIEKIIRHLRKFSRPGTRKNLDRDYLDQIDNALEKVGLKESDKNSATRAAFSEWLKTHENEGILSPSGYVEQLKTHYSEMTYGELSGLDDHVKNLEAVARHKQKIKIGEEERDFNETMDKMHSTALEQNKQVFDPEDRTPKHLERWNKFQRTMSAWLVKIEFLVEQLDGDKENGRWWNAVFRPVADAENVELAMHQELTEKLGPILGRDTFKNLDKKIFINNKAGYYDKNQVVSMALNAGNEYNFDSLIDGMEDQEVTREDIQRILNENLTAEDWQTVQDIWDLVNSYWPQIAALQRKLTGVVPEKVAGTKFTTPFGQELDGGYYPLVFDTKYSYRAFVRDQKIGVEQLLETNFLQAYTKKGHINERKNSGGQAVKLDIKVISQHLNNVIHDLSYREAILQVDKVIQDGRTRDAVSRVAGIEMYQQLRPWLAASANPNTPLIDPVEGIAKWIRKNTTIVNMGFKLSTAVVQQLGYSQSFEVLGERWAMHGLARFYGNPLKAKELTKFVMDNSIMMRNRMTSFDREISDAIAKVKKEHGVNTTMQQWAFKHIGFMDMSVSIPSWIAGYDKAQSQGMSVVDSIAMGDRTVRMSQSSGNVKDLARIQQGSEYRKLIAMFFTYFSSYYNLMRRRAKISGRQPPSMAKVGRNTMSLLYLTILPAVLSELILGRGPDDDDEEWDLWAAKQIISYPLASIPIVRDVANAAVHGFGYEITPVGKAVEDMLKAPEAALNIAMGDGDEADFKKLVMATGYVFGLPSRQVWTLADNTMAIMDGDDLAPHEYLMIKEQRER